MTTAPTITQGVSSNPRVPPSWARDLVIYELNPRLFTSPDGVGDGNGSGTFRSLRERLPYLADLGVNGIWMAGHHEATDHFYGIWSVYACASPDRIDASLGSPEDLKELVADAHAHGIRVFLDVIAHGVLHGAPLTRQHPEWFPTASWGMADYDYTNAEFRAWWIQLWVDYVLEYDVDGFRIDVAMGDIEIWDEVVTRTRAAGHDIVVFPENERYHFSQQDIEDVSRNITRPLYANDFSGRPRGLDARQLSCHDFGWQAFPGNHYFLKGSRARAAHGALLGPFIPLFLAGEEFDADPSPLAHLTQGLFGDGGRGGWMYGNRLLWEQLEHPEKRAMLSDVKAMLRVRRQLSHLVHADRSVVEVVAIPFDGATDLVPYAVTRDGREALIVVANDKDSAITTRIRLPREELKIAPDAIVTLTDAVTGVVEPLIDDSADIAVGADRTPGGGFRALHLTVGEHPVALGRGGSANLEADI